MPKLFISGIALILLLAAGYGLTQAARSIPWNCDDWQAFAHADRTTAILESLAENRGKTLYCGIDQSDTFTKAETWAAGKDRNERDDTVYFGERGQFRGFISAQEGWLTDGESGITGQSQATIFEFPKEERQGRRVKYKQFYLGDGYIISSCGVNDAGTVMSPDNSDCAGGFARGNTANNARQAYNEEAHPNINWPALAKRYADLRCRSHPDGGVGYKGRAIVINTDLVSPDDSNDSLWAYWTVSGANPNRLAYQFRPFTANCVKKIKGPRRR